MSVAGVAEWVLCGGLLLGIIVTALRSAFDAERRGQLRVLMRLRGRRAERVAVEASVEDPEFSPEAIRASVSEMLDAAEAIWAGREERQHRRRGDIQLIRSWADARRREIGAGLRIAGRRKIDIVGVVNRESEDEDRTDVRLRLRIHRDPKASGNEPGDGTPLAQRIVPIQERWTLARRGDRWLLAAYGGAATSRAMLCAPMIASATEDEDRVRESALRELAANEVLPASELGEVIDSNGSAPDRLRELSELDDRFSPELLEEALRHVLQAWEARTDGAQRPLEQVATTKAIRALINPGSGRGSRLIRDAKLADWKVSEVDPAAEPPRARVWVKIQYDEFGTGGRETGSGRTRTQDALVWTLRLEGGEDGEPMWRLTESAVG